MLSLSRKIVRACLPVQNHGVCAISLRAMCHSSDDANRAAETYYNNYYNIFQTNSDKVVDLHLNDQMNAPAFVEDAAASNELTHTDELGQINMVNVDEKPISRRSAVASCVVSLGATAFPLVESNAIKKGDVLCVAKVAGIMAAKRTSEVIPLCHNIPLSKVDVSIELQRDSHSLHISCTTFTKGQTGVEMESLVGVTTAALTVYDMCKAVTHDITISDVKLLRKSGGVRGDYVAQEK